MTTATPARTMSRLSVTVAIPMRLFPLLSRSASPKVAWLRCSIKARETPQSGRKSYSQASTVRTAIAGDDSLLQNCAQRTSAQHLDPPHFLPRVEGSVNQFEIALTAVGGALFIAGASSWIWSRIRRARDGAGA